MKNPPSEKDIDALTLEDLRAIPIWRWRKRNGREVVSPTSYTEYLTDDTDPICGPDAEILIVLTQFTLANHTVCFGYCSPWDPSLYYAQPVIILDEKHIPLIDDRIPSRTAAEVATAMNLEKSELFPIQCETVVQGKHGRKYSVRIDLSSYR